MEYVFFCLLTFVFFYLLFFLKQVDNQYAQSEYKLWRGNLGGSETFVIRHFK
jgi:hypothetical protein